MKKIWNLGMVKIWQNRIQSYIGIVNFIMLFYLYIIEEPLGVAWYLWFIVLIVGIPMLLLFDLRFVWSNALHYQAGKNPRFMELLNDVKQIKRRLDIED